MRKIHLRKRFREDKTSKCARDDSIIKRHKSSALAINKVIPVPKSARNTNFSVNSWLNWRKRFTRNRLKGLPRLAKFHSLSLLVGVNSANMSGGLAWPTTDSFRLGRSVCPFCFDFIHKLGRRHFQGYCNLHERIQ